MNKQNMQISIPVNLSRLRSAAGFACVLLGMIALVLVVWLAVKLIPAGSAGVPLLYLLDEVDDELEAIAFLAAGSVVCGLVSRFLKRRQEAASPRDAEDPQS